MSGKTHVICGTTALIALAIKYPDILQNFGTNMSPFLGLVSVAPFSKIPDVDLATTSYGKKYPIFSKIFSHRGMTHTLLFPAVLMVVLEMCGALAMNSTSKSESMVLGIFASILFGGFVGWIVHIVADAFNKKGVPILWPLTSKKFHIPCMKFKSNNPKHEFVFLCLWVGGLFLCLTVL